MLVINCRWYNGNMKRCLQCQRRIRIDRKSDNCRACDSTCHCGNVKDQRAVECLPCGMSRKAKLQWAAPNATIRDAVKKQNIGSRGGRRYEDLSWDDFKSIRKMDGRVYVQIHVPKRRLVYRSVWLWEQVNGPVPPKMHVHHQNHDPTDDRMDNFELLSATEHGKHHMTPEVAKQRRALRGKVS